MGGRGSCCFLGLAGPVVLMAFRYTLGAERRRVKEGGKGEPALISVRGWSCDADYWPAQV
ncbi:hypothetical protein CO151_08490 [bacterium CG_4_9_14_3_um_filter_65_15]|nr:MAG: hypothetical protein CO151_08490 [bacterium CG_4_9_14_3_um_filter_65_15]